MGSRQCWANRMLIIVVASTDADSGDLSAGGRLTQLLSVRHIHCPALSVADSASVSSEGL